MTLDERNNAVAAMTHVNDARFNLLDKISKDSPSYGAVDTPPQAVTVTAAAAAAEDDDTDDTEVPSVSPTDQTRAEQKMEMETETETDMGMDYSDEDDDDDDDEDGYDDEDDEGDEASETDIPDKFTHYFEGIELEWLSPDDYSNKYVRNITTDADTPDDLQRIDDAQSVHNARVRLLRDFTSKYDPDNNNAFFKRLKKAKHCHRIAPLKIRFDNDSLDDVYAVSDADSEAVIHAFFFLKNFRNIAHAHLQRYFDDNFGKVHVVKYEHYLKKDDNRGANAFFFSKFASDGVLFFLYVRYTQSVNLLTDALGLP